MKAKVWVLSTNAPDTDAGVFLSESEALEAFEVAMLVEWRNHAPPSELDKFPDGDPFRARAIMKTNIQGFPDWRITSCKVDVPIPQAFRDLLLLARPLMEESHDYRMMAVLEACEALVEGAEASPAPAEDLNPMEVYPSLLRRAAVSLDGNTFKAALHTSDPKMRGGFDGKP